MSDDATIALKAFKEGQKGKHHPIWGVKDVEDAWYAGIAWQKEQTHKHSVGTPVDWSNPAAVPLTITPELLDMLSTLIAEPHWLFAHLFGEDGKPIPKPTSPLPETAPSSIGHYTSPPQDHTE